MECPYLEAWEVVALLPIRSFCELFCGLLPLLPFEYEVNEPHEWGIAVLDGTPFEIFIQRWCENNEPAFDEPFTIMLTPQHERQNEFPITDELRAKAQPWIEAINVTLKKTGGKSEFAGLQNASQTSLAFWNSAIDLAAWNNI